LITSSSAKDVFANNDSTCSEENKEPKSNETVKHADSKASKESDKVSAISKPETSSRLSNPKETEDDLQRTVFISNIPFECDTEEVKQRFSAFGVVEYFAPVLHQLTKYVL
jgi:nucleolar protein 4